MKWTVGAKIGTGFGLALLIFLGIGLASYHSMTKLTEAEQWVTHTYTVLGKLDTVLQALTDSETGQRGYLLTSNESYLDPYHAGLTTVDSAMRELRELTRDNPNQQRNLDSLDGLVAQRLTSLKEVLELQKTKGSEAAHEWMLSGKGKLEMDSVRRSLTEARSEELRLLKARSEETQTTTNYTRLTIVAGTIAALVFMTIAGTFITRNIAGRLGGITEAARKIAAGDLSGKDSDDSAHDEIAVLAEAFTAMRTNLKDMASQVRQATENVNSTASEVLASTQQQAAAAKQQAGTIQEITSTLEEINQSGAQIGERARQIAAKVETATAATQRGTQATQETTQTMEGIRNQVEEVAEKVVNLSERTQAIGEIVATVSEIAEQSNLLALNASIEAVSAGEQGGRFAVVAHEMKTLADRAKDCTVQVRTILSEIQKGINTSVMLTEEAVKRVESGKQRAQATEATILEVAETNDVSIQAFQQIVAGANQQQIGVTQVTQGMQDMRQAVKQTAASTVQLEKAAANMSALSQQLQRVATRYRM